MLTQEVNEFLVGAILAPLSRSPLMASRLADLVPIPGLYAPGGAPRGRGGGPLPALRLAVLAPCAPADAGVVPDSCRICAPSLRCVPRPRGWSTVGVGGAAVRYAELFATYSIGLAIGFSAYLMVAMVANGKAEASQFRGD